MVKSISTYIIALALSVITLFSCTETIDMDYTTDFERLVVDAQILDGDTIHYVKLSKINLSAEDGIVSPISTAVVSISDDENTVVFAESDTTKGLYLAPDYFRGEYGKNYTLTISETEIKGTDGNDFYTASAKMGMPFTIDSIAADYYNIPQFGMLGYMLSCWAVEPPERNYYLFKAWKNGVLLTDTLYEYQQTDDIIFNNTYINGADCVFLQDEKPDEFIESGDTLCLEINDIDKAFYDYLNSAQKEYWGSNPLFGGPPANVISNVSNGAVGIFRVYSVNRKTMILEKAERY